MRKVIIAGNWKSNKGITEAQDWLGKFNVNWENATVVLCVPFTLLYSLKQEIDRLQIPIELAAQNVSPYSAGAYTGEIHAAQIKEFADWVIIGPGSLLTGIIPTFLATGMAEAIQQTHAKLIYVSNLMTQPGQTDGFSVKDHILTLQKYAGRAPDFVVANKAAVDPVIMEHYKTIGSRPILDGHNLDNLPCRIIQADLVPSTDGMPIQERIGQFKKWTHLLVHNAAKLADILSSIIV